ncbi:hypothetical protein ACLB2K_029535 [Fragaria x ananassa]
MTTLGYGDLIPNSTLAKLTACAFVFTGMALVALILSKAADYLVERQELLLIKALHRHQKFDEVVKEVETKSVRASEFVKYKLKEMGKINQEDVRLVMKEFEALDVDRDGSLSISDVTLAQSSTP